MVVTTAAPSGMSGSVCGLAPAVAQRESGCVMGGKAKLAVQP